MIKQILLFGFFLITNWTYAQFGEQQEIASDFQTTKVFASDLDGDGDLDVLVSGWNVNSIAWYENLDGLGNFGPKQYITQTLNFTQSLSAADLDGDGDQDILASSRGDDKIVWYKNLDGLGDFSSEIIINANAPFVKEVVAVDIDADGDKDIVAAETNDNSVIWYENIDGLGSFSTKKIVSNNTIGVYEVTVADVDGDGFMDVLCNSSSLGKPSWFKNLDGEGAFGSENIIDLIGTFKLITGDVDSDGDVDLIKRELVGSDNLFTWLENTDGLGNFEQKQIISNYFQASDLYATDIDNDGDIDLFTTYIGDGKIAWFENEDGLGTFGNRKVIDNFASISIVGADLDGDGYKDALTLANHSPVWYKNLTYLEVADKLEKNISIYPNPVQNTLYITNINNIAINQIEVFNILGKKMLEFTNVINKQINLSKLNAGLYFIHIKTLEGLLVKKVVKE